MQIINDEKYYTITDAAKILDISNNGIMNHINKKNVTCDIIDGRRYISESAMKKLIKHLFHKEG